jgi:hypothetical protein
MDMDNVEEDVDTVSQKETEQQSMVHFEDLLQFITVGSDIVHMQYCRGLVTLGTTIPTQRPHGEAVSCLISAAGKMNAWNGANGCME